jgi:hypothetical protein
MILYRAGSTEPYAVVCGECERRMWRLATFGDGPRALEEAKRIARHCCTPEPCECGAERRRFYTVCDACLKKRDRERLHADFEKARKVLLADYDGAMVYTANEEYVSTGDWDDEYHSAFVLDDGTRFVWGTEAEKATVDLEWECSENWLEEHHEDASDWVDFAKLREAQKLVDEALAGVVSYYEDRSVAVILPPPSEDEGQGGGA